jgi:ankyrin repeat protein
VKSGYTDVVNLLLQHPDIDINIRDTDGWTALMRAVDGGHTETVRLLLGSEGIDMAIGGVGFWDSVLESGLTVRPQGKYMPRPEDLLLQLDLATRNGH